jgi:hypothetical protein
MNTPRTSTPTLIAAMLALARDIESPDGVASAAILEAAERLERMRRYLTTAEHEKGSAGWPEWFRSAVKKEIE